MGSPSREDDRLSSLPRLPGDAGHMREVGAPLPAVQPVLPELSHLDALHNRVIDSKNFSTWSHVNSASSDA